MTRIRRILKAAMLVFALAITTATYLDLFLFHVIAHFQGDRVTITTNTIGEGAFELAMFAIALPCVVYAFAKQSGQLAAEYHTGKV